MVLPTPCQAILVVIQQTDPAIVLEQMGTAFFHNGLAMVVKDRSVNATYPNTSLSKDESQQKFISDFTMIHALIDHVAHVLPALFLAKIGDRGWKKVPIVVSLFGSLQSSLMLLLVIHFHFPLEVMFGAAILSAMCGGLCSFWSSVMTLSLLSSTVANRSKAMVKLELLCGITNLVANLVSGHLFLLFSSSLGRGTFQLSLSTLLILLCLIHVIVLLQVNVIEREAEEGYQPVSDASTNAPAGMNKVNVLLVYAATMLYTFGHNGAESLLNTFLMKEPLNWNAIQLGYVSATGSVINITSFLGVVVFRRCVGEILLILIGMVSYASGIFLMSFVTTAYMFYLARTLNMFSLIPLPIIRILLSQQVPASSLVVTFTSLHISMKLASLAYVPAFTEIYQSTLSWFPGFIFTLSSIVTVLGMIPISIIRCRSHRRHQYERIPGN